MPSPSSFSYPADINNYLNDRLQTRTNLQNAINSATSAISAKQQNYDQLNELFFTLITRRDNNRARMLVKMAIDLHFNLDNGVNLFYGQGALTSQELSAYQNFVYDYQGYLNSYWTDVNNLPEGNEEVTSGFIASFLGTLQQGLEDLVGIYRNYAPGGNGDFYAYAAKISFFWRVIMLQTKTLPGCNGCGFNALFFAVGAADNFFQPFKRFVENNEGFFDPNDYSSLLVEVSDLQDQLQDIYQWIQDGNNPNSLISDLSGALFSWLGDMIGMLETRLNIYLSHPEVTPFLQQNFDLFSSISQFLSILDFDDFESRNPNELREYLFQGTDLILQHYRWYYQYLIYLLENNEMELQAEERDFLFGLLSGNIADLDTETTNLRNFYQQDEPTVPAYFYSFIQDVESGVNQYFADNQFNFSDSGLSNPFKFVALEGSWLSLFQYFTVFLNIPAAAEMLTVLDQVDALPGEIQALQNIISQNQNQILAINQDLAAFPQYAVSSFNDMLPVLLSPVRLETKFVDLGAEYPLEQRHELLIRIYPDQISVNSHEANLTENELNAGKIYWQESIKISVQQGNNSGNFHQLAAWRALLDKYTANRSSWIVKQTQPVNLNNFTNLPAGNLDINDIQFPAFTVKDGAWTKAATADGMPDKFVVSLYQKEFSVTDNGAAAKIFDLHNKGIEDYAIRSGSTVAPIYSTYEQFKQKVNIPTNDFLTLTRQVIGNPVTPNLQVGLNPALMGSAFGTNQLFEEELDGSGNKTGRLIMDPELKWMTDFGEAEAKGMGIRVKLSVAEWENGFSRLVVLGIRAGESASNSGMVLEGMLQGHAYTDGLRFIPQGTPTNNTETVDSGFSSTDKRNADGSFGILIGEPLFNVQDEELEITDGQRFTEALGLPATLFHHVANSNIKDISEAKAMNTCLWPSTLGYFMEEMMRPVFSLETIDQTKDFFTRFVLGRGFLPTLGIGSLPYGIMPATNFRAWAPKNVENDFERELISGLKKLDITWTERLNQLVQYPAFGYLEGKKSAYIDQQNLLSILSKEATSGLFDHRYILGTEYYIFLKNRASSFLNTIRYGDINIIDPPFTSTNGLNPLLEKLDTFSFGLFPLDNIETVGNTPRIFDFIFQEGYNHLMRSFSDDPLNDLIKGTLIDDAPLSEKLSLRQLTDDVNYIKFLLDSNFDQIRMESFPGTTGSNALLYYLLRESLLLQYWDAATKYQATINQFVRFPEIEFFNMKANGAKDLSRWDLLYEKIGNNPLYKTLAAEANQSPPTVETASLAKFISNLDLLQNLPTARLERLFAEHVDLCSYRLDSWKNGLIQQRLLENRQQKSTGIYLGAFGWLEDVKRFNDNPDRSILSNNFPGMYEDPDNMGFIHAPSINQATAAAVLRHAYKSRQFYTQKPFSNRMAINLSSERTRKALKLMEGIKAGQSLAVLLGYQFERALHEAYQANNATLPDLNQYIVDFRKKLPLQDDYNVVPNANSYNNPNSSLAASGLISARDVVDGLRLVELYMNNKTALEGMIADIIPNNSSAQGYVNDEVAKLADTVDAISDLVNAESIYQSVHGNYEAANATLESISKGKFPVAPEIINTPRTGTSLTQKVILQLPQPGSNNTNLWGNVGINATPLSVAEPSLNLWLGQLIGSPDQVELEIAFSSVRNSVQQLSGTLSWTLVDLGLQPINLFYLMDDRATEPNSFFDKYVRNKISQALSNQQTYGGSGLIQGDELTLQYDYKIRPSEGKSLEDITLLLSKVRKLISSSRPVNALDLMHPSDPVTANVNPEGYNFNELDTKSQSLINHLMNLNEDLKFELQSGTSADASTLIHLLLEASLCNIPEGIVSSTSPTIEELLPIAEAVSQIISDRLLGATNFTGADATFSKFEGLFKALFGNSFKIIPGFFMASIPAGNLETGIVNSDNMLPADTPPAAVMEEWLQGLAVVRDKMDDLEKVLMLNTMFRMDENRFEPQAFMPLTPVQLPIRMVNGSYQDHWIGIEYPETYNPDSDKISLVMLMPEDYSATGLNSGLLLDEWTEVIPNREETTGVTFHYDRPNTEAAQTLLLAVSPVLHEKESWTWEDLLGAVNDSLDTAKKRLVDPDHLSFTHLCPFLPAIVAPVSQFATTIGQEYRRSTDHPNRYEEVKLEPTPR